MDLWRQVSLRLQLKPEWDGQPRDGPPRGPAVTMEGGGEEVLSLPCDCLTTASTGAIRDSVLLLPGRAT